MEKQIKLPKFWDGWAGGFLNVMEEATLPMHIVNLLVIATYPVVYLGCLAINKLRAKKNPN